MTPVPFKGSSMNPLFKGASHVMVDFFETPRDPGTLCLGDVVLFQDGGEWVCHRIIHLDRGEVLIKGDHNTSLGKFKGPAWGVVRGVSKKRGDYRIDRLWGLSIICHLQKKQCSETSFIKRKFYRSASRLLLSFNEWFFVRPLKSHSIS